MMAASGRRVLAPVLAASSVEYRYLNKGRFLVVDDNGRRAGSVESAQNAQNEI